MRELDFNRWIYLYQHAEDRIDPDEIVLGDGYSVITWPDIEQVKYPDHERHQFIIPEED